MIQSDIFDSINMNIKKITNSILLFLAKRLAEIFGILVLISGILLLISLISYSPEDPNFIFPENTDIKNILGFRGSYISDLFFQSIGLISYLFSIFVDIKRNMKRLSETIVGSKVKSRYALEFNAGLINKLDIRIGDKVLFNE